MRFRLTLIQSAVTGRSIARSFVYSDRYLPHGCQNFSLRLSEMAPCLLSVLTLTIVSMWRMGVGMDDMSECGIARWAVKSTGRSMDVERREQKAQVMSRMPIPRKLSRGWRESLRNESLYRRRAGWTAIITADPQGYRITLRRMAANLEDALADANGVLQ